MRSNDPIPDAPEPDEVPEEELDQISAGAIDSYLNITPRKPGTSKTEVTNFN